MVGEYSLRDEGEGVTHTGALRSTNACTSNRKKGESPFRRKTKVFHATVIDVELVGPKVMADAGTDGHRVNIP